MSDTTTTTPVLKDTAISRPTKTSPLAMTVAVLAIALVGMLVFGRNKIREHDKAVTQAEAQLAQSRGETTQVQSQLTTAHARIDALQKEVDGAQGGAQELQTQLNQAKTDLAGLQKQVTDVQAAGTALQTQLDEANAKLSEATSQSQQSANDTSRLQTALDQAKAETEQAKTQLQEVGARSVEFEARAVKAEDALAALQKPKRK